MAVEHSSGAWKRRHINDTSGFTYMLPQEFKGGAIYSPFPVLKSADIVPVLNVSINAGFMVEEHT